MNSYITSFVQKSAKKQIRRASEPAQKVTASPAVGEKRPRRLDSSFSPRPLTSVKLKHKSTL